MLIPRLQTAAIAGTAFALAMFAMPAAAWGGVIALMIGIAAWEWAALGGMVDRAGRLAFAAVVGAACVVFALVPAAAGALRSPAYLCAGLFWLVLVPAWGASGWRRFSRGVHLLAGIATLVPLWFAMFDLQRNPVELLSLLAVVWVADSSAYFAGRRFGRRKLAPAVSPGKTWEGVAGAIVGVGVYFSLLSLIVPAMTARVGHVALGALVMAMVLLSVEGDLFESALKRRAGVKDSGSLLPGHGGVLDRIDGWMAALPLAGWWIGSGPG
jgi:phosphatidate cytidylyltransferase